MGAAAGVRTGLGRSDANGGMARSEEDEEEAEVEDVEEEVEDVEEEAEVEDVEEEEESDSEGQDEEEDEETGSDEEYEEDGSDDETGSDEEYVEEPRPRKRPRQGAAASTAAPAAAAPSRPPSGPPSAPPSAPPTAPPSGPRLGPPSGPTYTGSIPLGRLPPPPTDLTSAHALPPHSSLYGLGATPNAMQGWHGCQWAVASMGGLLPAGRASMAQQRPLHPGVPHGLFASSAADSRQAVLAQYLQSQAVAAQRQGAPSSLPRQGGLPASGRANQQPLSAPAVAPAALPMAAAPPPSAHRASGQGSVTAKELD